MCKRVDEKHRVTSAVLIGRLSLKQITMALRSGPGHKKGAPLPERIALTLYAGPPSFFDGSIVGDVRRDAHDIWMRRYDLDLRPGEIRDEIVHQLEDFGMGCSTEGDDQLTHAFLRLPVLRRPSVRRGFRCCAGRASLGTRGQRRDHGPSPHRDHDFDGARARFPERFVRGTELPCCTRSLSLAGRLPRQRSSRPSRFPARCYPMEPSVMPSTNTRPPREAPRAPSSGI
jgi:hypothetical protein